VFEVGLALIFVIPIITGNTVDTGSKQIPDTGIKIRNITSLKLGNENNRLKLS